MKLQQQTFKFEFLYLKNYNLLRINIKHNLENILFYKRYNITEKKAKSTLLEKN